MNGTTGEVVFNWLHLTDLHLGMDGLDDFWPNVKERFFESLESLLEDGEVGPLDLVLFTGDLVQRGDPREFERVDELLEEFWDRFDRIDSSKPKLLAVPGNHDLVRPPESTAKNPNPTLDTLMYLWEEPPHIQSAFWNEPDSSPQRRVVDEVFMNYMDWWKRTRLKLEDCRDGMLPGDFSATFEKPGVKLGIVGLNSTFLQLVDGSEREGKMDLHVRQFNKACGEFIGGAGWVKEHDLCLLLTHHPPNWLSKRARTEALEREIHPRGQQRFALHLFGHLHEGSLTSFSEGGARPHHRLQGRSLFGVEEWEGRKMERSHGYSLGQLKIKDRTAELRIWPYKSQKELGWKFEGDTPRFDLESDGGIAPVAFALPDKQRPTSKLRPEPNGATNGSSGAPPGSTNDPDKFQRIGQTDDPILIARLDALQRSLCDGPVWLIAGLKNFKVGYRSEDLDEVDAERAEKIREQLDDLHAVYNSLNNNGNNNEVLTTAWQSYERISHESQQIFGEYLDLIGGLSVRDETLRERNYDTADVADRFIRVCAHRFAKANWLFESLPTRQEALDKAIARTVRLRFPQWTVWRLPLIAHELGHMVIDNDERSGEFVNEHAAEWVKDNSLVEKIKDNNTQKLLGLEDEQIVEWIKDHILKSHIYEILADTFATYMMGPAYICAAVSLQLDPFVLGDRRQLADAERAKVMFILLERMGYEEHPYGWRVIDNLRQQWDKACSRVGSTEAANNGYLTDFVEAAQGQIGRKIPVSGRYSHIDVSRSSIAENWAEEWSIRLGESPETPLLPVSNMPRGSNLRDVLNAAWFCRIKTKEPHQLELIAQAAHQLCETLERRDIPPPGHRSLVSGSPRGQ